MKSERKRQSNQDYDARRRQQYPWRAWYSTPQWRALRASQLTKFPLCQRCASRNIVMPATVAHHVKAHKGDPVLFFDPHNLASSCSDCHDTDEQRIERGGKARQVVGADGWPIEG